MFMCTYWSRNDREEDLCPIANVEYIGIISIFHKNMMYYYHNARKNNTESHILVYCDCEDDKELKEWNHFCINDVCWKSYYYVFKLGIEMPQDEDFPMQNYSWMMASISFLIEVWFEMMTENGTKKAEITRFTCWCTLKCNLFCISLNFIFISIRLEHVPQHNYLW